MKRSALAGLSLPPAAALLAACERPGTASGLPYPLARPDDPVTWPIRDDNQPIADGMSPEKNATLQIYNWDQYVWKKVVQQFCDKYDCKYEITTFNNMDEALSKIRTGQLKFDVFFPTIDVLGKLVTAKILQPLNHSYIPNLESQVWPVYRDPFYDRKWRYSVPYVVYTTGVGYRRDEISDDKIRSLSNPYDILWDPTYKGRVGIYDDYREAMSMVLLKHGITNLNTTSQADIELVRKDLIDMIDAVNIRTSINGAYLKLPEDVYTLHQAWSGDMVAAWFYTPQNMEGYKSVGYWYPEDRRGCVGNDLISIPANSPHPVLAHLFLNWMLDFKHSMDNFAWVGYQPPQDKADPERLTTQNSVFDVPYVWPWLEEAVVRQEDFDKGYMYMELTPTVDKMYHDAWEEFKAGAKK